MKVSWTNEPPRGVDMWSESDGCLFNLVVTVIAFFALLVTYRAIAIEYNSDTAIFWGYISFVSCYYLIKTWLRNKNHTIKIIDEERFEYRDILGGKRIFNFSDISSFEINKKVILLKINNMALLSLPRKAYITPRLVEKIDKTLKEKGLI